MASTSLSNGSFIFVFFSPVHPFELEGHFGPFLETSSRLERLLVEVRMFKTSFLTWVVLKISFLFFPFVVASLFAMTTDRGEEFFLSSVRIRLTLAVASIN